MKRFITTIIMALIIANLAMPTKISATDEYVQELCEPVRANLNYTFNTIDGKKISTMADTHKATVIIFGKTTCPNTQIAVKSVAQSAWAQSEDVRIIFAECNYASLQDTELFADTYGCDKITFCYDESYAINNAMWNYLRASGVSAGYVTLPVIVFIDSKDNIQSVTTGYQTSSDILAEINHFAFLDDTTVSADNLYNISFTAQFGQSEARTILDMINELRTSSSDAWYWNEDNKTKTYCNNLSELKYDYELEKVAMKRAMEIAISYSHTRPNGDRCFSAYDEQGYYYYTAGENIAAGYTTATGVNNGWREDNDDYAGQGHRRNMLNSDFKAVGIGHVYYNGCHYWVEEFSGNAVGTTPTAALDSQTECHVDIAQSSIDTVSINSNQYSVSLDVNENVLLPQITTNIITHSGWPAGKNRPILYDGIFRVEDTSIANIQNEKIVGIKTGTTNLIYESLFGKTITIPVTVQCVHDYKKTITKEPTAEEEGIATYVCEKCNDRYTEGIPKLLTEETTTAEPTTAEPTTAEPTTPKPSTQKPTTGNYQSGGMGKSNNITVNKGSAARSAETKPASTKIKKIKKAKKSLKVTWAKQKNIKGYQLQYATNKKFKKAKKITIKKAKTVSKTIKKLKAGKKYYVRIRTYKVVNGKKVYSDWSKAKSQKTK